MSPILLVTCLIVLVGNLSGARQLKHTTNGERLIGRDPVEGQEESIYPISYLQALEAATQEREPFLAEPSETLRGSQFPSLINPNIALSGPNRLSKYKTHKTTHKPTRDDFRKLLVSISSIQPSSKERVDGLAEYLRMAANQDPVAQSIDPPQSPWLRFPAAQDAVRLNAVREQLRPRTIAVADGEPEKIFKAENMATPYDEIKDQDEVVQGETDELSSRMEPKTRRKLVNEPSHMRNSPHLVNTPQAYQQSIGQASEGVRKDSILSSLSDVYFVALVACVSSVAIFSVIGAGYCFYKVQQSNKVSADVDFPSYGVIGPASRHDGTEGKCVSPNSDRKLAQSAQMYHYHHQKQQMISTDKGTNIPRNNGSDIESDEENEDGEYTVYECPGLAPTGEMEVKNPLFQDDLTPMSSPSVNGKVAGEGKASAAENAAGKKPAPAKND